MEFDNKGLEHEIKSLLEKLKEEFPELNSERLLELALNAPKIEKAIFNYIEKLAK